MAGVTGLTPGSSPTTSFSSRFVLTAPGTPYGALRSPTYERDLSSTIVGTSKFDTPISQLHRRRGATVSVAGLQREGGVQVSPPSDFASSSWLGPGAQNTTVGASQTTSSQLGDDLPYWARTTFAPQTSGMASDQAWNLPQSSAWQMSSMGQVLPSNTIDALPQARFEALQKMNNMRRRSSVDDMGSTQKGVTSVPQNHSFMPSSLPATTVSQPPSTYAVSPDEQAKYFPASPPPWLNNRSVSHQQLSRDQMLKWAQHFGDRSRTPQLSTFSQQEQQQQSGAEMQSQFPPNINSGGEVAGKMTTLPPQIAPQFSDAATSINTSNMSSPAHLRMDLNGLPHSGPASSQTSPQIFTGNLMMTGERRGSGGNSSSSSRSSHLAAPARRFSGQDPLDPIGEGVVQSAAQSSSSSPSQTVAQRSRTVTYPQYQSVTSWGATPVTTTAVSLASPSGIAVPQSDHWMPTTGPAPTDPLDLSPDPLSYTGAQHLPPQSPAINPMLQNQHQQMPSRSNTMPSPAGSGAFNRAAIDAVATQTVYPSSFSNVSSWWPGGTQQVQDQQSQSHDTFQQPAFASSPQHFFQQYPPGPTS